MFLNFEDSTIYNRNFTRDSINEPLKKRSSLILFTSWVCPRNCHSNLWFLKICSKYLRLDEAKTIIWAVIVEAGFHGVFKFLVGFLF